MSAPKSITIVGGGLAGLTLGIGLRQRGIPVTVYEAGRYPRHRVCGEFISGRGQEVLDRLGLRERLRREGAIEAKTARFFAGHASTPVRSLSPPAISISRFALDALLADEFRRRGGDLREAKRWSAGDAPVGDDVRSLSDEMPRPIGLLTSSPTSSEAVVYACGRRSQPVENSWRWFGLKVHARGVNLSADLEMHSTENGYVGMNRLAGDAVNICGLFRRRAGARQPAPEWQELLRGLPGSSLRACLDQAEFNERTFCSIAGLSLRPQRAIATNGCRIGDALTMIPPVTGNGMSLAFESAELALGPVTAYSRRECCWQEAQRAIAQACNTAFARRLAWARWLQWLMFSPLARGRLGKTLLGSEWLWGTMFSRTR